MKKVFALLAIILVPVTFILLSNSSGSPGGRSGSIGDNGNTCTGCHSGTATSKIGWITTNVPTVGYTPGQTYTITATGTHPGVVKFGFELTVEDSQGNKVGTLQLAEPTRTKFTNGNHAVTHTSSGTTPSGSSNTWTVNWVAPSNVSGNIGIYAAFNAANGNGNTSGDVIYKSSTFITKYVPQPNLISILPSQAEQGSNVTATITAENTSFGGTTPVVTLALHSNPSEVITATNVTVINNTTLSAGFSIPVNATAGLWDLHVDDLTLSQAFEVLLVSGLEDLSNDIVRIYPNPAIDRFYVENAKDQVVSIFKTSGELVANFLVADNKQEINISGFNSGLYLVKITGKGITRTEKLLVN
jgi:hypothetical protein